MQIAVWVLSPRCLVKTENKLPRRIKKKRFLNGVSEVFMSLSGVPTQRQYSELNGRNPFPNLISLITWKSFRFVTVIALTVWEKNVTVLRSKTHLTVFGTLRKNELILTLQHNKQAKSNFFSKSQISPAYFLILLALNDAGEPWWNFDHPDTDMSQVPGQGQTIPLMW
jgi:hypothetical protein